jgi:hypothetical protein
MRTRPPVSPRTITRALLVVHQAIPDLEQDWFTRKELLDALSCYTSKSHIIKTRNIIKRRANAS